MTKVQQTRCILQAAPVVNGLRKCARKLLLVLIRSAVESHGVCVHVTMYACMLVYVIYVYVCNTVYTCFIVCSILELTAPVSRNTLSFSKFTCVCTHIAATQHTMVISQTVTLLCCSTEQFLTFIPHAHAGSQKLHQQGFQWTHMCTVVS
jgi:hypothetical protein